MSSIFHNTINNWYCIDWASTTEIKESSPVKQQGSRKSSVAQHFTQTALFVNVICQFSWTNSLNVHRGAVHPLINTGFILYLFPYRKAGDKIGMLGGWFVYSPLFLELCNSINFDMQPYNFSSSRYKVLFNADR